MLREKKKCGACWLAARMSTKPRSLWIRLIANEIDFIAKYFGVEWPSRSVYHAMINTSIGDETVVQSIVNFMKTYDSNLTAVG